MARTHRLEQERLNGQLTPEQVRANKTERCKARNERRRAERRAEGEGRIAAWRQLSTTDQIAILGERPGYCRKQIARILKAQDNDKTATADTAT